jgi:hypothetical protein
MGHASYTLDPGFGYCSSVRVDWRMFVLWCRRDWDEYPEQWLLVRYCSCRKLVIKGERALGDSQICVSGLLILVITFELLLLIIVNKA